MRKVRKWVCIIFVISCVVFAVYQVKTKMVEDHQPPTMSVDAKEIQVSVSGEDADILAGVKAKDNKDGDISKSVRISSMSHFIEKGKRTVEYVVFDKANNAASISRTLTYSDYVSPRIYLKKPLRYSAEKLDYHAFVENMIAEDCLDGDISNQIRITRDDKIYGGTAGEYQLIVQVNNSAGDVCSLPLSVVITETKSSDEMKKYYPALSDYIVYTKVNETVDAKGLLVGLQQGEQVTLFDSDSSLRVSPEDISVESHVDYGTPGVYDIVYSYTAKSGVTATTKLFVVVEE